MRLTPPSFGPPPARPRFTWNALLWALVYPKRAHRIVPTIPGVVLVSLSFGIGLAAYNSSSNILFLTLSLLLSSLVLSGVLSWLNIRRVTWRLVVAPVLRAGHDTLVTIELRNAKTFLPTYGLAFTFRACPFRPPSEQRPESTITARGAEVRAALNEADAAEIRGEVAMTGRLEPRRQQRRVDWVFQPRKRGLLRIQLVSVGSLFPFGFLRKDVGTDLVQEVVVWPAVVEYRRHAAAAARRSSGDERVARAGSGNDLLAVRRYQAGDSHRLIHWKASARTRQLLVRQYAAETAEGCAVAVNADLELWPRREQFDLFVGFAATLVEDLFREGRLLGVAINEGNVTPVRRMHDLEEIMNRLAVLEPAAVAAAAPGRGWRQPNTLTFAPDGARGVAAWLDGRLVASA